MSKIFALLALALPTAAVAGPAFKISAQNTKGVLVVRFEDAEDVPNACDYSVRRFEHLAAINAIVADLEKEFCPVDRYGKGKAFFHWTLPSQLRDSFKLDLIVNQKKIGTLIMKDQQTKVVTE